MCGTGVGLCDFITLHANFDRGRQRRQKTERDTEREERDEACAGNGSSEEARGKKRESGMIELQACCLCMHLQAN